MRATKRQATLHPLAIAASGQSVVMRSTKVNAVPPVPNEPLVKIESKELLVEIGTSTGSVRRITLKRFLSADKTTALRFGTHLPLLALQIGGAPVVVQDVQVVGNAGSLKVLDVAQKPYELSYEIDTHLPIIRVSLRDSSGQLISALERIVVSEVWERGDALSSNQNRLEALSAELKDGKPKYHHFGGPWKIEKNVPRGTFLLALAERHFCMVTRPAGAQVDVKLVPSTNSTIAAVLELSSAATSTSALVEVYVGPRDYFHLRSAGFQQAFPVGMLGQIGLGLLWFLSLLAKATHSYGIAIILFSIAVTGVMAPFSLLGFRSMKRMQELKPQVDKIMTQHKNDQQKANKEVFQLYKENRVSPLGGCLPMLLQMPIFIALFQAMSHFIELRGASFFGIRDLSLPDQLLRLPIALPLIGSTINLLPIVMSGAMYLQTRASQKNMGSSTTDNPTAQMMSGPLMPAMFLFMFYQFPAGLVLFWLMNSLTSMLLYRLVK